MMTQTEATVTPSSPSSAEETLLHSVSAFSSDGASVASLLASLGLVEAISEHLRIDRHHGYAGIDLFSALLSWFASPVALSLRRFMEQSKSSGPALAALFERRAWPSQGAVSRMLNTLSQEQAEEFVVWLLNNVLAPLEIEHHPDAMWLCRLKECWTLFDFDPMVEAMRQRQLADDSSLPPVHRRSVGKPGYLGRKRGQIIRSLSLLALAGTGQWLGAWGDLGNADTSCQLAKAVQVVVSWARQRELALQRCIVRYDGGVCPGVKGFKLCQSAGLSYLTRLNCRRVLEGRRGREIEHTLACAQWHPVEDSGSGPKREAAELGCWDLSGEQDESFATRIVVTRFAIVPKSRKRHGAGINKGAWHYESFATDLDPAHWPAADLVTLYYDRSSIENRIQQGDRELDLNRTASRRLAGQTFAVGVGLFLWNLQFWHGCQEQYRLDAEAFRRGTGRTCAPNSCCDNSEAPRDGSAPEPEPPIASEAQRCKEKDKPQLGGRVEDLLRALNLTERFAAIPATRWRCESDSLPTCPAGAELNLTGIYRNAGRNDTYRIVLRPRAATCRSCPLAPTCLAATTRRKSDLQLPQLAITITAEQYRTITNSPPDTTAEPSSPTVVERAAPTVTKSSPQIDGKLPHWKAPEKHTNAVNSSQRPLLVASYLRRSARQILSKTNLVVVVRLGSEPPKIHPAFAKDSNDRSHRRKSWGEKLSYYALPPGSKVELESLCCPPMLDLHHTIRSN
jgi:hypothetical protein